MSDPKVIYLGPACEADTGDGRTWAEDDPWPTCECGHKPVRYVLATDFDRVTAERDALQLRLNAADQRIDELSVALASIHARCEAFVEDERDMPLASVEVAMSITARAIGKLSASAEPATAALHQPTTQLLGSPQSSHGDNPAKDL